MPGTGKEQQGTTWPLVKFQFSVTIGSTEAVFQEVTGLNAETQQIEYRGKNSGELSPVKMPGIQKFGNVTLKKGIFKGDNAFWDLHQAVKMNVVEKQTIIISLSDENNAVAMSWKLVNAFPSKITGVDFKPGDSEMAVESIELVHEGLTLTGK